jgi:hypothetical protein
MVQLTEAHNYPTPHILWVSCGTRADNRPSSSLIGAEMCRMLDTDFREFHALR